MHTLIVGGTGAIGQALIKKALVQGHKVTATTRSQDAPPFVDEQLQWYVLDPLQDDQVHTMCQQLGEVLGRWHV